MQLHHRLPAEERRFQIILWLAMVASILIYVAVANLIQPTNSQQNPELFTGLLILACMLVAGSIPMRRAMFSGENGRQTPQEKRQGYIVALVMCQAAAVFGIIARFAFDSPKYYLFFVVGLFGQLLHYPRQDS